MKKAAVLGMVLALLLSLSGCGAFGQKEKPEVSLVVKMPTLTMDCVSNPEIQDAETFLRLAAEKFMESYQDANVSISVEVFDYVDENEAIVGCYGTPEAVDVLYEGYFNMSSYVSGGHVVPLDDIISEELRADISEASWNQSMKNGKTYMMPLLSMQNICIYNRQMLRDCGLEEFVSDSKTIQNWTLEEWEIILDTLAEKLPEDSYPMMMYSANNQGDTHIMSFLRMFGGSIFDEEGNFNFQDEKVVKALKWLQDGVEKGWYPPHPENIELADNHQLFLSNQLAIYLFNNANFVLYQDRIDNVGYVNFPGNIATSFITGFEVFDNGDAEKVKVAKEFIRFIYETDELLELSAGNIPESKTVSAKYADQIEMLSEFTANEENVIDFMNSSPNWQGQEDSVRSVFWPQIHELLAGRVTPEECAEKLDQDCNAAIHVEVTLHD